MQTFHFTTGGVLKSDSRLIMMQRYKEGIPLLSYVPTHGLKRRTRFDGVKKNLLVTSFAAYAGFAQFVIR